MLVEIENNELLAPEDFAIFAEDWGRWLMDQSDCRPQGAACFSLESNWKSPQRWHDEKPLFFADYNLIRAQTFERLANEGHMTWREKRVLDTHYVHLSWWRLTQNGAPREDWDQLRLRHSRAHGRADYLECLETAERIMCRLLKPYEVLL